MGVKPRVGIIGAGAGEQIAEARVVQHDLVD